MNRFLPVRTIVLPLIFAISVCGWATTSTLDQANFHFANANAAYRQQVYDKAVAEYEEAVQLGIEDPTLFYNLGTAYARVNRPVESFAYLTRASRLKPRDGDIRANLERARKALYPAETGAADTRNAEPGFFQKVLGYLSAPEWLALLWISFTVVCVGLGLRWLFRYKTTNALSWIFMATGGAFMILLIAPATVVWYRAQIKHESIALNAASVQSGPAERFPEIAKLKQGQIVKDSGPSAESTDYRSVRLEDGTRGYIKTENLLPL